MWLKFDFVKCWHVDFVKLSNDYDYGNFLIMESYDQNCILAGA